MATELVSLGGIRDRGLHCVLDVWWKDRRFEYDASNNLIYSGTHRLHNADQGVSDGDWVITKYTYDASNNLTRMEILAGSWTGRAALAWG